MPDDFDERRETYCAELDLRQDSRSFAPDFRTSLGEDLWLLNAMLPGNDLVRLRQTGKNLICVTPLERQPEPSGVISLKSGNGRIWQMTGLLDVPNETALDTLFLDRFESSASRERRWRIMFALYAAGTNAGLKRVAAGAGDVNIDELADVYWCYIDAAALRAACSRLINTTLANRNPGIWGPVGMCGASDSSKFGI